MRWKESYTSLLFIAPTLVYVAVFSVIPTIQAVYGGFQTTEIHWTLLNYTQLEFFGLWSAIVNTIIISLGALALQFVLGFIIASIMNSQFRGHRLFSVIALLPWGVATVVAAFSFSNIFMATGGYANSFLKLFGAGPVDWYSTFPLQVFVLVVSDSWKNTPVVALIVLAGMTSISPELYHAASVDGAGRVNRFFHITLPNVRNFVIIALVIRGISEFNIFALPLALVGTNPPLLTTLTYSVYENTTIYGQAYAASTVLLAFVLAFAILVMRFRRV